MKRLLATTLIGQQGVNLIERRLLAMGQVWRPTAIHDTGVEDAAWLASDEFDNRGEDQGLLTGDRNAHAGKLPF